MNETSVLFLRMNFINSNHFDIFSFTLKSTYRIPNSTTEFSRKPCLIDFNIFSKKWNFSLHISVSIFFQNDSDKCLFKTNSVNKLQVFNHFQFFFSTRIFQGQNELTFEMFYSLQMVTTSKKGCWICDLGSLFIRPARCFQSAPSRIKFKKY